VCVCVCCESAVYVCASSSGTPRHTQKTPNRRSICVCALVHVVCAVNAYVCVCVCVVNACVYVVL